VTAGREDVYLGFFYRNWGGRPDAISQDAQQEYIRAYRLPGAMRAGFNLYRATLQDVADNEAWIAGGRLLMPILRYGRPLGLVQRVSYWENSHPSVIWTVSQR
jgi:hypothetical protein